MANQRNGGQLDDDPDKTVVSTSMPKVVLNLPGNAPANAPAMPAVIDDDATVIRPTGKPLQQRTQVPAPTAASTSRRLPLPNKAGSLALPAGFRLHEYRIDKVLGQGGFGITYLATDVNLNSHVAIKEYLPEDIAFRKNGQTVSAHSSRHQDRYRTGLDSFLIEGRTLASFKHPNIVRVSRFFEAHQTAYMVLEYERGAPLKTWWPRHNHMPEKELTLLLQPLLDGLAVVHGAGFLHRDIKPDNIQVRRADGSLVLLDFGSARQAISTAEQADVAVTPGFAPIEQYQDGEQGAWTDIYAMGATLYWMLTGEKPADAMDRIVKDPLKPIAQSVEFGRYSPTFLQAVDWALKLQPQDRPQDVEHWREMLFAAHASSLGVQEALRAGDLLERERLRTMRWGMKLWRGVKTVLSPWHWPLALKLSVAMVLTALLPMGMTGYYNMQSSLGSVSDAELRNLQLLARSTAGRMAQLIADSQNLSRTLSTDGDFIAFLQGERGQTVESVRRKMLGLVVAMPEVHVVMLLDAKGNAVVSSNADLIGRNFAFRDYFQATVTGQPFTSSIVVGAVSDTAGMVYAYPVQNEKDETLGAVVLRLRATAFDTILKDVRRGESQTAFLVDGDGVVIRHSQPKALFNSLGALTPAMQAEIKADQRFGRDKIESLHMPDLAKGMVGAMEQGTLSYRSTLTDQDEVLGFAPVNTEGAGFHWVVGVSELRAEFEKPLNLLFERLLLSVGVVGVFFLLLSLAMARRIVLPIKALTRAVDALKSGDYSKASVKVQSRDEVGQLSRTFNVLIDVLRQRDREHKPATKPKNGTVERDEP